MHLCTCLKSRSKKTERGSRTTITRNEWMSGQENEGRKQQPTKRWEGLISVEKMGKWGMEDDLIWLCTVTQLSSTPLYQFLPWSKMALSNKGRGRNERGTVQQAHLFSRHVYTVKAMNHASMYSDSNESCTYIQSKQANEELLPTKCLYFTQSLTPVYL